VLGADPDAQELRDRARAAGFELAQRYSARVSHVAYGSGIDPEDARYAKIRDAGLPLVPLQACASELGLHGGAARAAETAEIAETAAAADTVEAEPDIAPGHAIEAVQEQEPEREPEQELEPERDSVSEPAPEADLETERGIDLGADPRPSVETLAFPPLAAVVIGVDPWEGEQRAPEQDLHEPEHELAYESAPSLALVPALEPEKETETAAETETELEAEPALAPHDLPNSEPAARAGVGRFLSSILWALIPFATFGLLTPITFGYAAYRLRSRGLALTTVAYTIAVVLAFVLSAARPHASAPSDAAGALLTVCLAGTWVGGTLHALSLRTRVFAR
jgi:hypothetical protein